MANNPEKITQYKTADGKMFDTASDAEIHTCGLDLLEGLILDGEVNQGQLKQVCLKLAHNNRKYSSTLQKIAKLHTRREKESKIKKI